MAGSLPSQLEWRRFCRVLTELGYVIHKEGPGSARAFINSSRHPQIITFHEPHSPATLSEGTLRSYIRRLRLSRKEFLDLLNR